jgi:hypothetical protein
MDPQATETFEHAIQLAEAHRKENPRGAVVHSDLAFYYPRRNSRNWQPTDRTPHSP